MKPWNWSQYKTWIETTIDAKKNYYYRGQRDPSWKLQTTFHRASEEFGYTLSDYLNIIVPDIHYYVCAHHNELLNLQDNIEFGAFLALLQHHGFPTPLLDWSLSPYIAAYFAFKDINEKHPQSDNVRIYIFDASEYIGAYEQILDLTETTRKYVSVMRPLAKHNQRLIPQRGVYTLTNVSDMENHLINLGISRGREFLHIIDIPVSEKPKVMKDLNLMGINDMTLFPGMDGVCNTLKRQYFSKDTVGLGPSGRALLDEVSKTMPKN